MAEDTTTDDGGTATGADTDTGTDTGQQTGTADLGDAGQRALADERRARKAAERELAALRKASMTEQEKAVAEARAAGLAEAQTAAGPRLVRAEFRAAATNRVDKETLDAYLEDVDLSKFLGDDGEPDVKAIEARIKRLGGGDGRTDYDGGARGGAAKPQDMSSLIRMHAGVG
jgi:uncharacterized iron-regulated membrane protein